MSKERDINLSFAVIVKDGDYLLLITRAKKKHHVTSKYPASDYTVWDVTGNDERPGLEGANYKDITIDSDGNWKIKVTKGEIEARKKAKTQIGLKKNICLLAMIIREAETQGYTDIIPDMQKQIDDLKKQLLP